MHVERVATEEIPISEEAGVAVDFVVGVVGNPNSGKTTIFNGSTGARQRVGNWPGVTVEQKIGHFFFQGQRVEVVDLPCLYSLDVQAASLSLDERIARDFILSREPDLIVNVVDAANLERNLYLTVQLLEMKVPLLVILNMMDVVEQRGFELDAAQLAERLGPRHPRGGHAFGKPRAGQIEHLPAGLREIGPGFHDWLSGNHRAIHPGPPAAYRAGSAEAKHPLDGPQAVGGRRLDNRFSGSGNP
ncbi:MAG: hypothetical protein Kow0060_24580 [Methylohalobius crimeensis]